MVADPEGWVLGPAIMRGNLVYSLPKPCRHHEVIKHMAEAGVATPIGHGKDIQGFMTAFGFKDRRMTANILNHKGHLCSEDLW
jgi:hypothetical protein